MIRAAFFACGLFLTLGGAAAFFIDAVVLNEHATREVEKSVGELAEDDPDAWSLIYVMDRADPGETRRVVDPPDWAGFGFLSIGSVTTLYALCLPGRRKPEDDDE